MSADGDPTVTFFHPVPLYQNVDAAPVLDTSTTLSAKALLALLVHPGVRCRPEERRVESLGKY